MGEQLRCNRCGRFMSIHDPDAVSYTPFGGVLDVDPPDPEYMCGKCWRSLTLDEKTMEEETNWIPPHHIIA